MATHLKGKSKKAATRMRKLFEAAESVFPERPELADRYMELAWKLKLRFQVPLTQKQKLLVCRKCQVYLGGKRRRIRFHNGIRVLRCNKCGYTRRHPYKK